MPAPYILPTAGKSIVQGGKDKGIENGPLPEPKQSDPCGPGKNQDLNFLLSGDLVKKMGKGKNLQKKKKKI